MTNTLTKLESASEGSRLRWANFYYRNREFERVKVHGLVLGIWGIWAERSYWSGSFQPWNYSVTHLPTGFAMARFNYLEDAQDLVVTLHEVDDNPNPWQPCEAHLRKLAQIVRPTKKERKIIADWEQYWHCNRPALLKALETGGGDRD